MGSSDVTPINYIEDKGSAKRKNVLIYAFYSKIQFNTLSFACFLPHTDLQLRPYRTDDFITKLYYESSRFGALNQQWVVKARVNDDERNPSHMIDRHLTFQLILKSRITAPLEVQFIILSGPFTTTKMYPKIFRVEFNNDNTESQHQTLPLIDSAECNKVLSGKTINLRLILVQVQK